MGRMYSEGVGCHLVAARLHRHALRAIEARTAAAQRSGVPAEDAAHPRASGARLHVDLALAALDPFAGGLELSVARELVRFAQRVRGLAPRDALLDDRIELRDFARALRRAHRERPFALAALVAHEIGVAERHRSDGAHAARRGEPHAHDEPLLFAGRDGAERDHDAIPFAPHVAIEHALDLDAV